MSKSSGSSGSSRRSGRSAKSASFNRAALGLDPPEGLYVDIPLLDQMREEAELSMRGVEEGIRRIRDHFTNLQFEYEGVAGSGAFGMAFRVLDRTVEGRPRRLIVKKALGRQTASDVSREIGTLKLLSGGAHLARVMAVADDGETPKGHQYLVGLEGPTIIMEYLENGDILRLAKRTEQSGKALPNRVLWRIYLCFLRACVGLAYPPNKPIGSEPELEEIPEGGKNEGGLYHGDMHMGNVLIGTPGDFDEHELVPPVKLIDFGETYEDPRAVQANLLDVSRIMLRLITGRVVALGFTEGEYQGIITMGTVLLPDEDGDYEYPTLDPDLRDLLIRCLAVNEDNRPRLDELLDIAVTAVDSKDADTFGDNEEMETDEAIRDLLQEVLYDAPLKDMEDLSLGGS